MTDHAHPEDEAQPDKPIQAETALNGADPEYMTLDDDGQAAFDAMWRDVEQA